MIRSSLHVVVFITIFVMLFGVNPANAQGFYAGGYSSYGMPLAGSVLGTVKERNPAVNTTSTDNVRGSFGSGLNFGLYGGYMLTSQVGAEVYASYLAGTEYHFSYRYVSPDISDYSKDAVSARSLRVVPAVRLEFGEKRFKPVFRLGCVIGLMNKITDQYNWTSTYFGVNESEAHTFEMTGNISVGFMGSAGVNYTLGNHWAVFAEVTAYALSWGPAKGRLTRSERNGQDNLASLETYQKEYEFVNHVDQTMNTQPSESTKMMRVYFPMSSVGGTLGIHYRIGNSE